MDINNSCYKNIANYKKYFLNLAHLLCNNTDINDDLIKELPNLIYLSCNGTKITDAGINKLTNLEYLCRKIGK